MRILHTSDWHLGRVLHELPLLEDQKKILDQILGHCRTEEPHALVVSGDLFDRSLPSEEAVRLWSGFLGDFRRAFPELPLLVIAGNHDSAARVACASEALALAGIHVRGGPEALETPVEIRGAGGERLQAWMIPFLWAGDLDGGDEGLRTQEETLERAIARIRPLQDPAALQLAVSHCFARGGLASDSERLLVGTATDVDAGLFGGFDYTALGHLHRRQRVGDRIWYPGSPLAYSFSECGDAKGLLRVDLARDRAPEVTPLPLEAPRPLARIRGTLPELLEDPRHGAQAQCLLEATLCGAEAGANPFALLRQRFPYLLHLRYDLDEAPGGPAPAPAERSGDLLSDYRQFAADIGHPPDVVESRTALARRFAEELARMETL